VHEFTNKVKLCRECFIDYFERKIFRTIRKYQMGMLNIAGDKKDARYKIIKIISGKIKISRSPKAKAMTGIKNLNDFSAEIISGVMNQRFDIKDFLPKAKNKEFPLYFMPDKEILLYAKLKRIKGKIENPKGKSKQIDDFLVSLEKKNPDIRLNVVNALLKSYS